MHYPRLYIQRRKQPRTVHLVLMLATLKRAEGG